MQGIVKYNELMAVGEYKEAMEYADAQATKTGELATEWLELGTKAPCKLIDEQRGKGNANASS
jgi:hypothetical protein